MGIVTEGSSQTTAKETGLYSYRWVVLASFMLVTALNQLMWLTYAPVTSRVESLMGTSELHVVLLGLMFPLMYIPLSIPAGIIVDRKGFRFAVTIGAALTAGFTFLRLFVTSYPLVLVGMIGIAAGQPFILNSITKMESTWFPHRESALATGMATVSMFVGMMVALFLTPVLLRGLGDDLAALQKVVLYYSLAAAAGFVVFLVSARARPPVPPERPEGALVRATGTFREKTGSIFALQNYRLLCVAMLVINGTYVGILQLLEKILKPRGISTSTSGAIGASLVLGGILGCVIIPAISDRMMRRKPFLVASAILVIPVLVLLPTSGNRTVLYIAAVLLGLFLFSSFALVLTLVEETTGPVLAGTGTSFILLIGGTAGVGLTLLLGSIKQATGGKAGSYFWAVAFLAALSVVWLLAVVRLDEARGGP